VPIYGRARSGFWACGLAKDVAAASEANIKLSSIVADITGRSSLANGFLNHPAKGNTSV